MNKTNITTTAEFATRAEASAYHAGIRLLQDLCPDRDIRVHTFAPATAGMPWRTHVQCLVATESPYNAGGWDE